MSKDGWFLFSFASLAVIVGALIAFVVPENHTQRLALGIQAALMAGLFLVTAFYAKKTSDIAKATFASVAEMQKHRFLESQPWVFPKLMLVAPDPLHFENVGNGPAIDLKPFISNGKPAKIRDEWKQRTGPSDGIRTGPRWPILKAGTTISWQRAFETPNIGEAGVIAVEYRDIYGREFLSG